MTLHNFNLYIYRESLCIYIYIHKIHTHRYICVHHVLCYYILLYIVFIHVFIQIFKTLYTMRMLSVHDVNHAPSI